uniref:Uncharacterized protein n=1 Tax=Meloidogyne enterolobii TaxID=390850 RepID=A0A6V7WX26_MELEN|nr:unnamed protein product [Meloidogyne enterolobii]
MSQILNIPRSSLQLLTISLLIFFTIVAIHSQLFYEKADENVSTDRLHPANTDELNKCLSPDLEEQEKSQFRFFAAVIDAGSTGTRLHIFEFSHDTAKDPSTFKLETETYRETKPGVSAFAKTPEQAAENIRVLLLIAKKHIPEELWAKTPITFRATAGVRLLNDKEAEGLLSHIETEIMSSGLLVDDDAVGMLSGTDEGVFGWFTLNFLLQKLDNVLNGSGKAATALDLGGGSTQVTFIPSDFNTAMRGLHRQKYSHRLKIFEKELRLYTHSYLGNGLVASRLGIAKLSSPDWSPGGAPALKTHCLPKKFILDDFDYAGNVWLISATIDASFENCLETAKHYVTNLTDIKQIKSLVDEEDLYLFGYFYDRGLQGNIVEYTLEQIGGEAKVGDYKIAAEKACAMPSEAIGPEPWQPWQCLDLTYIYTLLHYGYGLPDDRKINLVKKIRSMEVSWALGAGFHLLNSYHENKLKESRDERQRQLKEALERDREDLETRRKAIEEKEAATDKRLASLSTLAKIFHWFSDWMTHLLTSLNLIS